MLNYHNLSDSTNIIYIYNINTWDLKFRFDTGKYAGIDTGKYAGITEKIHGNKAKES